MFNKNDPTTLFDDQIALLLEKLYGDNTEKVEPEPLQRFIRSTSPHLSPTPHLQPLIKAIEESRGKGLRICVSMPPRHGKTTTLAHAIPYFLKYNPGKTFAYATYAAQLSKGVSRVARDLGQEVGIELDKSSKALEEWRTTSGGGMFATSVGGILTGKGITGLMIVDDPFKSRRDADSYTMRETVWNWFTTVVFTRLEPGSSCIVVHTRWHEDDLIGRLMSMPDTPWTYLNMPALDEEGNSLWPESYNAHTLGAIKKQIGDFDFEALYQGNPRPRGSNVFNMPASYKLPETEQQWKNFVQGKYIILAADPAASEKTTADHSVALALMASDIGPSAYINNKGEEIVNKYWVLDVRRLQTNVPEFVKVLTSMQKRWGCPVAVEAVAGFKAVPQMLKSINPNLRVLEIHPTRDKFQRAQGVAACWNQGNVMVPTGAGWTDTFVKELGLFTGVSDKHDDQVDALAHAWNTLINMKKAKRGSEPNQAPFG